MRSDYLERGLDFDAYLAEADMNVPTMKRTTRIPRLRSRMTRTSGPLASVFPVGQSPSLVLANLGAAIAWRTSR